jgi:hypothetical protein
MPKRVRIELDRAGVRDAALTSDGVRAELRARAERIAAAARSASGDDVDVNEGGKSRARFYVTRLGAGAQGEAHDRALGTAIDAGRTS